MPEVWWEFRRWIERADEVDVGGLVQVVTRTPLPAAVRAAYDAPFPDATYQAGVRAMPLLVPTTPDDPASAANRAAWQVLSTWDRPFLVAFSDGDPITAAMGPVLAKVVPGAAGFDHPTLPGGHFVQEDAGPRLGEVIAGFIRSTGRPRR